jgi:hypothetical protein
MQIRFPFILGLTVLQHPGGFPSISVGTEKGDLFDPTDAADARGTRAPHLLGNNDPVLHATFTKRSSITSRELNGSSRGLSRFTSRSGARGIG